MISTYDREVDLVNCFIVFSIVCSVIVYKCIKSHNANALAKCERECVFQKHPELLKHA